MSRQTSKLDGNLAGSLNEESQSFRRIGPGMESAGDLA